MPALFLSSQHEAFSDCGGTHREQLLLRLLSDRMQTEWIRGENPAPSRQPIWRRILGQFRPESLRDYSPELARRLREKARPGRLLWISRFEMARYLPLAKKLGYRIVLDEHSIESETRVTDALTSWTGVPGLLQAANCAYHERRLCQEADAIVASCELDAVRLRRLAPSSPIHVIPALVETSTFEEIRNQEGLEIFLPGLSDPAQHLGTLNWFAEEILPRIRSAFRGAGPKILASTGLSHEISTERRITFEKLGLDFVSTREGLGRAAVVAFPVRSGNGPRLRILEAMASARPVVCTGKAAEGLVLTPGFDAWVADSADGFTSSIVRMIQNRALATEIGQHAARTVQLKHDLPAGRASLDRLLGSLGV